MMKRFGSPPQQEKRYTLRPGAYAILPRNGRLLLTEQAPGPELQLPGGGIDQGEHPLAALHREVMEETGWKIGRAVRLGAFRRFTFMPEYDLWAEKLCIIYCARPVRKLSAPTEPGHRALWLGLKAAALRLDNPGDAHFVEKFCL
ncbi:NUDIX hydrolase [Pelagimonas varians]|uniref:RNA pyrophosphohydrolase n=1 Tax=Pelagimonas varians TaxID=696760 RepID=A0A238L2W3_9RHOB|nr:NUDIX hydrolase [Pelagimonas varians]PYG26574.1 8-oxo-dGTP diphosphatase [Pelagimonas varians]SMX49424.1 RNA pyrophosphohydrolase [Pelagimonas varians]